MALKPIVVYPHDALARAAVDVESVDDSLRRLVDDMVETMHAEHGVGLAANQVDDPRRVTVIDPAGGEDSAAIRVLINPRVITSEGRVSGEEGCLSFPGIFEMIERPASIRFVFRNLQFEEVEEVASDYFARVVCHEVDHLEGVVFLQRMSPLKRRFALKKIEKLKRQGEWPESV